MKYIKRLLTVNHYEGKLTDFKICKKCMGMCCYKNACSCAPSDFNEEITKENIERILDTGKYMITATYIVDKTLKTSLPVPIRAIPHISAREVDADSVHISLLHSKCKMLDSKGCMLNEEERPTQGLLLIPGEEDCTDLMPFPSDLWYPYKEILDEVVIEKTGMTTQQHLEKEAIPLLRKLREKLLKAVLYGGYITHGEFMALSVYKQWGALSEHESWALEEQVKVILPDYPGKF